MNTGERFTSAVAGSVQGTDCGSERGEAGEIKYYAWASYVRSISMQLNATDNATF